MTQHTILEVEPVRSGEEVVRVITRIGEQVMTAELNADQTIAVATTCLYILNDRLDGAYKDASRPWDVHKVRTMCVAFAIEYLIHLIPDNVDVLEKVAALFDASGLRRVEVPDLALGVEEALGVRASMFRPYRTDD